MRLPCFRLGKCLALLSGMLVLSWTFPAMAQYAMVTNLSGRSIVLLDTATYEVVGFKEFEAFAPLGCAITQDATTAYVTTGFGSILVFDLPSLRLRYQIDSSPYQGEILVVGSSDRALVASLRFGPIAVLDLNRRREVSFSAGRMSFSAIDHAGNYVLGAAAGRYTDTKRPADPVQPLQLLKWKPGQRFGSLVVTDRGLDLPGGSAGNPAFAPGGGSGAVIDIRAGRVVSFTVPRLTITSSIQPRLLGKNQIESIEFHPSGNRLFVKSTSALWAYAFDARTGEIGRESWRTNLQQGMFSHWVPGLDQLLAVGDRLFVLQPGLGTTSPSGEASAGMAAPRGSIRVLDAATGATLRELRDYKFAGVMADICGPAH